MRIILVGIVIVLVMAVVTVIVIVNNKNNVSIYNIHNRKNTSTRDKSRASCLMAAKHWFKPWVDRGPPATLNPKPHDLFEWPKEATAQQAAAEAAVIGFSNHEETPDPWEDLTNRSHM